MDATNREEKKWELKTVEKKYLHASQQANFKYLLTNGDIVFSCDGIEYKGPLEKIVDTLNAADKLSRKLTPDEFFYVRIFRCSKPDTSWYADHIGEKFIVKKEHVPESETYQYRFVIVSAGEHMNDFIVVGDAEILS